MFDKILVAIDESDHAATVIGAVSELAAKFGSQVHVLHVLEIGLVGKAGTVNLEDSAEVHQLVADAVATLEKLGVTTTSAVEASIHGSVASVINQEAIRVGATAIVTGTRGLGAVHGMLVGSTTQKLLHQTQVPVLVIP